jgi:fructosamine-3-kinase
VNNVNVGGVVLDDRSLSNALISAFSNVSSPSTRPELLDRRPNARSSTFQSEIVTCRLADGRQLKVLCKYEQYRMPQTIDHLGWGHRRGHRYEADVYRRVLEAMGGVAPRCFGWHLGNQPGEGCLLLEYLEGAQHPVHRAGIVQAATWLARFHGEAEPLAAGDETGFLIRYDRHYYAGWARRTAEFAEPLRDRYPWVGDACARFAEHGAPVLERQPTVIHGEYYPKNVLLHEGHVYAIDWESCAVGAAEVDVAMLSEGWPQQLANDMAHGYARERWKGNPVESFAQRLAFANVYVQLRWLGEESERTVSNSCRVYFDELRTASERAGLLT